VDIEELQTTKMSALLAAQELRRLIQSFVTGSARPCGTVQLPVLILFAPRGACYRKMPRGKNRRSQEVRCQGPAASGHVPTASAAGHAAGGNAKAMPPRQGVGAAAECVHLSSGSTGEAVPSRAESCALSPDQRRSWIIEAGCFYYRG